MKIQYCSDLHLEISENTLFLARNKIVPVGDVLILAGDITYLDEQRFQNPFFDELSDQFERVFMIPGNHEFYGGKDVSILDMPLEKRIRENVYLYNNQCLEYGGVVFVFSTLWSMIQLKFGKFISENMADFKYIHADGQPLTIEYYNLLHQRAFQFLERAVAQNAGKKIVVVTHHLPSPLCNAPEFMNTPMNDAFCVNLNNFIESNSIDFWIYGHSHRNVLPQMLNGTQLLTNQLGYIEFKEHLTFKRNAYFEI
ncbi:metallophosphoesterase [Flexithrix dorotheae]|uniref:metallophosphoesterase n=1 Tax=Flexithrix dorotheae TaxID=70993 RepID=UPI0003698318|nr:metallophosphoesterase [Flexithrix dorotheae]